MSERLARVERGRGVAPGPRRGAGEGAARPAPSAPPPSTPSKPASGVPGRIVALRAPARSALDLEDLLGGRLLALVGAVAVLIGLAFLVGLAIDHGWIDERLRVALAFLGSGTLLGAGVWLVERRGRTQAALAVAGTGVAGLFLSLCAGSGLYGLTPTALALAGAIAVGAVGASLAVRWDTGTLAGLALVGALAAPVFVGAFPSVQAIAFLLVASGASAALLLWRRWEWLRLAVFVLASAQVAVWALADDAPLALVLAVLALVGALTAVAALGYEVRVPRVALRPSTSLLVAANALVTGGIGYVVLAGEEHPGKAGAWMLGIALAHLAAALMMRRAARQSRDVALLLGGVALTAADLALALLS
ncbi:MAG: DUF2339 domain-containing protein, partial [Actinomycetota bacterium]|nr:DUF2339 domain-containing protein [Actinomycetota bacterium]